MTTELALPALYIRHLADLLRARGADVRAWLAGAGMREPELADPERTIALPQLERLVEGALAISGEPALGLFVGERLLATTHGMLGYAALASGTVRQAVEVLERFTPLRIPFLAVAHEERPREVRIVYRETFPLGAVRRPLLEAAMLSVRNVLDTISLGTCQVTRVSFAVEPPPYTALARDLFRTDVRWSQPFTGFTLPRQALDLPLKMADPAAFAQAALVCQRELDKLERSTTVAARVRRLLLAQQSGFPSLAATARRLHLGQRTLHRRLVAEGTSFQEILESVRRTLATEYLASGHHSVEEVAYTLGYSDLANFRRAFKRWEGVPPSAWRARVAGRS